MCLIEMAVGKKHGKYNPSCGQIPPRRCHVMSQRKKSLLTVCEKLLRHKRLTTTAISRKYRPRSGYRRRLCVSGDYNEEVSVKCHLKPSCSPQGAMAPDNTTQYLMNLVYQDFSADRLSALDLHAETVRQGYCSPRPLARDMHTGMDNDPYDLSLDFQQRDFEDMLRLTSGCW